MDKFCPVCKSLLNDFDERVVDGTKTAVRLCSRCGYTNPIDKKNPLVYEHILREDKTTRLSMNPNIKHDLTLPHFDNIACPNEDCSSKSGEKWNVVGMKIDEKRLIWLYQCCNCDRMWKQPSRATL
jgi:DNA-directed RNA polymerase subunit M/transcription elongation factor TFIIS